MKNTFAVTMTLLLALTLGGSIAGYRIATTPHHAEEEAAKGGAESIGDPTTQDVKSEDAPTAQSAATVGSDGLTTPQGNVRPDQIGGSTSGENGAVGVDGGQEGGGAEESEGGDLGGGTGDGQNESGPQDGLTREGGAAEGSAASQGAQSEAESGEGGGVEGTNPSTGEVERGVASPTVQDADTQVGQTGASNVEKSSAGSDRLSDEKAAEIADTLGGDSEGRPGQDSRAEQLDETGESANEAPTAPATR
ncbi:hypothetical protein [Deinococcus budaensis]|uniref:Uncharacterized protein n=1 Tax=Deinococcus budaensis TaxID=1665626 RepID=A0A7W8GDL9_9DEIO|nr:hypothetical protein [Deinococcus budaensis]MBB5233548.1 hypothetical protein [Deinococcus budaensis]